MRLYPIEPACQDRGDVALANSGDSRRGACIGGGRAAASFLVSAAVLEAILDRDTISRHDPGTPQGRSAAREGAPRRRGPLRYPLSSPLRASAVAKVASDSLRE
jgi:hypothetical protein